MLEREYERRAGEVLRRCNAGMRVHERQMLRLYLEGWSAREIASALGRPTSEVRRGLLAPVEALRRMLRSGV